MICHDFDRLTGRGVLGEDLMQRRVEEGQSLASPPSLQASIKHNSLLDSKFRAKIRAHNFWFVHIESSSNLILDSRPTEYTFGGVACHRATKQKLARPLFPSFWPQRISRLKQTWLAQEQLSWTHANQIALRCGSQTSLLTVKQPYIWMDSLGEVLIVQISKQVLDSSEMSLRGVLIRGERTH